MTITRDGGAIEKGEIASSLRSSQLHKVRFQVIASDSKDRTAISGVTVRLFQQPHGPYFILHDGDLNFHSSSYQWLVVTGSNYARFKGEGTVNGVGPYKFMLWAGDGEPDTFRIKIWEEDQDGYEYVKYDNGMNQAIEGGSIVIHAK